MNHLVIPQRRLMRESLATALAFKRFLTRVNQAVSLQVSVCFEALSAELTAGLYSMQSSDVILKLGLG